MKNIGEYVLVNERGVWFREVDSVDGEVGIVGG